MPHLDLRKTAIMVILEVIRSSIRWATNSIRSETQVQRVLDIMVARTVLVTMETQSSREIRSPKSTEQIRLNPTDIASRHQNQGQVEVIPHRLVQSALGHRSGGSPMFLEPRFIRILTAKKELIASPQQTLV